MIDIKGITKSFGSLQVLKGIDLHINKGEVVSIVGPSGAGKTTLLQIIGTLDKPDSGSVVVDGVETQQLSGHKLSEFRNRHVGFVFQFHQLLPEFTWESLSFKVNFQDRVLTVRITRNAVEVANEGAPVELEIRGVRRLIADKVIMNCEL